MISLQLGGSRSRASDYTSPGPHSELWFVSFKARIKHSLFAFALPLVDYLKENSRSLHLILLISYLFGMKEALYRPTRLIISQHLASSRKVS